MPVLCSYACPLLCPLLFLSFALVLCSCVSSFAPRTQNSFRGAKGDYIPRRRGVPSFVEASPLEPQQSVIFAKSRIVILIAGYVHPRFFGGHSCDRGTLSLRPGKILPLDGHATVFPEKITSPTLHSIRLAIIFSVDGLGHEQPAWRPFNKVVNHCQATLKLTPLGDTKTDPLLYA